MVTLPRTVLVACLMVILLRPTAFAKPPENGVSDPGSPPPPAGHHPLTARHASFHVRQQRLNITVTDDNGKAVPSAAVFLYSSPPQAVLRSETDFAGRCRFPALIVGTYRLKVQKEGYYETVLESVRVGHSYDVDVVLTRQKEVKEVVNVTESPITIDPERTADTRALSDKDIVDIPFAKNRDYRAVLPYIPGVISGPDGQPHVDGAHTYETLDLLDGFNVGQPVTGMLDVRVSPDALRGIDVQTSRYSAQYGKASGGLLNLTTGTGDNNFRFNATNFFPTFLLRDGFNFNNWTPRLTFSGPILPGRAWFFNASEGEYDLSILKDLPTGANRSPMWRLSNLTKGQVNLSDSNILTGSFLVNHYNGEHVGLSTIALLPASLDERKSAYFANLKDQHYFHSGVLLEVGTAVSQFRDSDTPLGMSGYFISPERITGNYYRLARGYARRLEVFSNLFLPEVKWHGTHEFRVGIDGDGVTYHQLYERRSISILGENQSLLRRITFSPQSFIQQHNLEGSVYLQDRWSPLQHLIFEGGLRFDWDQIVGRILPSPRVAGTYMVSTDTKVSAGVGIFYDATNLDLISMPNAGQRTDFLFAANGTSAGPPIHTTFTVNRATLQEPKFLNWSFGLEQKLPGRIYLRADFLERRGSQGFVYANQSNSSFRGDFVLQNTRKERYDAITLTARRVFSGGHVILASYTRSRARSNEVLDFNVDQPIFFEHQAPGPLAWDAPNQFISWGLLPLKIWQLDFAFAVQERSGFPFSFVNQEQQLIGAPNSHRFPAFFSLNTHLERRFELHNYLFAIRVGFDNVTGRRNYFYVDNNIDSPSFLLFSGYMGRTFTGRIRFLGRK
jgi:hypothetical protein